MVIRDVFSTKEAPLDLVIADVDGNHGNHLNRVSDRVYFILEGAGRVVVGHEVFEVGALDVIFIPKSTSHGVSGKLRLAIITSPPFAAENEMAT
jgi:mannose-6-phosphate isomerase-like protein (cupin superfamily)